MCRYVCVYAHIICTLYQPLYCAYYIYSLSLSLTHPFYVDSNSFCVCCRHKSVCGGLVLYISLCIVHTTFTLSLSLSDTPLLWHKSVCGVLVLVYYTHADAYVLYMSLMCAQYHDIHWCSCEHDYRVFIV
jgi:hypothetical protein